MVIDVSVVVPPGATVAVPAHGWRPQAPGWRPLWKLSWKRSGWQEPRSLFYDDEQSAIREFYRMREYAPSKKWGAVVAIDLVALWTAPPATVDD